MQKQTREAIDHARVELRVVLDTVSSLDITLAPVAIQTQHLAVLGAGFAPFAPRRDVVGFHQVDFKVLAAFLAVAFLPLIGRPFLVIAEGADIQMSFIAG